jgi:hypothetical protein
VTTNGFLPNITLPTRVSDTTASLIDNFYCKLNNKTTSSGILTHKISDHQPYFVTLLHKAQAHSKYKTVKVRTINQAAITAVGEDIRTAVRDLNSSDNASPCENYSVVLATLQNSINEHLPIRTVKFNRHKHKKSPWITSGIIKSIRERDKLYVKSKHATSTNDKDILKLTLQLYNRILQKTIRSAKYTYYHSHFEELKHNLKKT